MPDITAIATILTSLNTMKNIAEAMVSLHDTQALQLKVIEFNDALIGAQNKILSVNEERTALIEQISELKKQLLDLEAWDKQKQRYELKRVAPGSFAYLVKADAQGTEPSHHICTNCYQDRKTSILQLEPRSQAREILGTPEMYVCPRCETKIIA